MSENIREYNFGVPGNIDRHIPGIPGTWPVGSIVFLDEDTNRVVKTIPEGAIAFVSLPPDEEVLPEQEEQPETSPAQPEEQPVQQPG